MPPKQKATDVDYSIVLEVARNFESLLTPPEIEYPLRESAQRSESSGLPDGSELREGDNAPIGEPLDKAIARMSREARKAWMEWIETSDEPKLSMTGEMDAPLSAPLEELMLSDQEKIDRLRVQRLMAVEEVKFREREESYITRLLEECSGLADEIYQSEPENRFYEEVEVTQGEFGQTRRKIIRIDRCGGRPEVRHVEGVHPSDIAQARFTPSYQDRMDDMIMTAFQTETWRNPSRSEEDKYIPNISPLDDPDYIAPSDMNSRNFSIYPPASRPYNIVFKVTMQNGQVHRLYPKGDKDYTSLTSLKYMLDQRGTDYAAIEIDEIRRNKTTQSSDRPNCRFEIDLRVTYGEALTPDPNNYKKVDPDTRLGQKLLQILNEQPYLFDEHVWEYEEMEEDGSITTTKKVAVGYSVNAKDAIGPRVYWVYLDEKANSTGTPAFLRTKRVPPQYSYHPMRFFKKTDPLYLQKEQPFLATVRVSQNFSYYDRKSKRRVDFDEVVDVFTSFLSSKGYILYATEPESEFNTVMVYKFIHTDTRTRQQRKDLFSKLTKNHD